MSTQCSNLICENKTDLKACGKCLIAAYCSKECQLAHWIIHKVECKNLLSHRNRMMKDLPPGAKLLSITKLKPGQKASDIPVTEGSQMVYRNLAAPGSTQKEIKRLQMDNVLRCFNPNCTVHAPQLRCDNCNNAYYCSKQCQKDHWHVHRTVCIKLSEPEQISNDAIYKNWKYARHIKLTFLAKLLFPGNKCNSELVVIPIFQGNNNELKIDQNTFVFIPITTSGDEHTKKWPLQLNSTTIDGMRNLIKQFKTDQPLPGNLKHALIYFLLYPAYHLCFWPVGFETSIASCSDTDISRVVRGINDTPDDHIPTASDSDINSYPKV